MHQLDLPEVIRRTCESIERNDLQGAAEYLFPALDQKPHIGALWHYAGALHAREGRQAVAIECFRKSYDLEPHSAPLTNIAMCLRQMGDAKQCRDVLLSAVNRYPDDAHTLAVLCASYVGEGDPLPGIEHGERIVDHPKFGAATRFNLALLNIEAGNYGRGFDLYATGECSLRAAMNYNPDPPELTPELHAQLKGKGKRLIVAEEQGLGDCLMFASMLAQARQDYEIILDAHPRLETFYETASWRDGPGYPIHVYPTRKLEEKGWAADAKVLIGNLGQFYRRDEADFKWTGPLYKPDPAEVAQMRAHLLKVARGRLIVGVAFRGGTIRTSRFYRTMTPAMLDPILRDERYCFVSLDYEDISDIAKHVKVTYGADRFFWHPSALWHFDYAHTASLVAATDVTLTITQSVAHLSAAMDHPTLVLTPSRPDWRMGLTGERWIWYGNETRLLRQIGDDWAPACTAAQEALEARLTLREAA